MNVCSIYMLSSLLVLFSCSSKFNKTPDFPQTDNKEIKGKKLTIPDNQNVVTYLISRDKKYVFVYTFENEIESTHYPTAISHLLIFGQNGILEQDVTLNINLNSTLYELFYTNTGILTLSNGAFVYFVDTQSFQTKNLPIYNSTNNLHYKTFEQQAKKESHEWEIAEIEKLNALHNLNKDEVTVENKNIPAEYWSMFRAIKNQTDAKTYLNQQDLFKKYVDTLIQKNQPLKGLMNGNIKYLLLREGEDEGLFQIAFESNYQVNWLNLRTNNLMSCTNVPNQLNWKNDKIQDATNSMLCLEKIKTSSYKDDLVGKMTTDFIIKLEMRGKQATFKLKDRPLKIAADGYFSLNNKAVVVMYKNSIYLIS